MPLVAGIDEAGYGPTLGPLVVAATLWRAPAKSLEADWWALLGDCVARRAAAGESRLAVDDSKRVFDRKRISTLERPVLAFARAIGLSCETVDELVTALGAADAEAPGGLPWEAAPRLSLPRDRVGSQCEHVAERLREGMRRAGVVCCGAAARVVTAEQFNQRVRRTRNKAAVLLEQVLTLLQRVAAAAGENDLCVWVDRLGGRTDYRDLLLAALPGRRLHELEVSPTCSRYRLANQRSDWTIAFVVDADQRHLPVALASMTAKYVRELLMERFNAFWRGLVPGLRPTAGYYADAKRFLVDIQPVLPATGIAPERFVRVL